MRARYFTEEKLAQRAKWSSKKKRKYANKVADRMEKDGVVGDLWREFRGSVETARTSKQGRFDGGWD